MLKWDVQQFTGFSSWFVLRFSFSSLSHRGCDGCQPRPACLSRQKHMAYHVVGLQALKCDATRQLAFLVVCGRPAPLDGHEHGDAGDEMSSSLKLFLRN